MKQLFFLIFTCGALSGLQFDDEILNNETLFESFRKDPVYARSLEPTSVDEGVQYAHEILFYHKHLLDDISRLKENDLIGKPALRNYPDFGRISSTTLRFIKTAADIHSYFGDLKGVRILYIGAGYGGVVKLLNVIAKSNDVTLLQHKSVNKIAEKYLTALGVSGIQFADSLDQLQASSFDLVIIDTDFSGPFAYPSMLSQLMQEVPRGYVLKRGTVDQFDKWISKLLDAGKKGMLRADLFYDENVRFGLYWRPLNDHNPTKILKKAIVHPSKLLQPSTAISNRVIEKRLGSQLLTYFKTLWLARTTQTPLLLSSFNYSDAFLLSEMDPPIGSSFRFKDQRDFTGHPLYWELSTLCYVPFTPESRYEWSKRNLSAHTILVDWNDPEFKELIKQSLTLKTPCVEIMPPEDVVSVAVHYRDGGSYEKYSILSKQHPLKFSHKEWIAQQLKRVRRVFPTEKLYVYIFTDHIEPSVVATALQAAWGDSNSQMDWGKNEELPPDERVISDFHSFKNFDCLIRPDSHFSFIAGKLGQFKLEIYPTKVRSEGKKKYVIDQLEIRFGD